MVLPSWYPPRGGEFFREHSQALAAEGLDVTVLACIQTSLRKHGLKAFLMETDIKKTSSNQESYPGSFTELKSQSRIIPFLNKANVMRWIRCMTNKAEKWIIAHGKPDMIQVHSSIWAGVAAARLNKRYGIPYVLTEHRSRFVCNTTAAKEMFLPWHYPLLHEAFTHASHIVTVSQSLQDKILGISGDALHHPPVTIPNMVDTRFFIPSLKQIPKSPFTFFCLAHLEPVKGIDTLIHAMHLLAKDNPSHFRLVIGGDGSQSPVLKNLAIKYGLQQAIIFTGALTREEVRSHLHKAHAFVLPSRFEAFGVVFIEAMACGLPVIATRSGGPESFIDKECGIIVNPDQPVALANAMRYMADHYSSFNPDTIWKNTIKQFSPKAITGKYIHLYQQILSRQHD